MNIILLMQFLVAGVTVGVFVHDPGPITAASATICTLFALKAIAVDAT